MLTANWRQVDTVVNLISSHLPKGIEVVKVGVKREKGFFTGRELTHIEVIWSKLVTPKGYHGENKNRSVFKSVYDLTKYIKQGVKNG